MTEKFNINPENTTRETPIREDNVEIPQIAPTTFSPESLPAPLSEIKDDVARAYAQVEALPGVHIETRAPVVDSSTVEKVIDPLVPREWTLITEVVRRKLNDPAMRRRLVEFIDQPVSQRMAKDMLQVVQADVDVASVVARSGKHLTEVLALGEVPEGAMMPDIKTAPMLTDPLRDVESVRRRNFDDDRIGKYIKANNENGLYTNALSPNERPLVLKKYAFARDVKMLALGAELGELKEVSIGPDGEATLPSGVHVKVSAEYKEGSKAFLDPSRWEYRRQFKDRVYEIGVDGRKYFLKERKTNRHRDTHDGGFREGLTSMEEFDVAVDLNAHSTVDEGPVRISWEKPVGAVEYPDGFSFTIFEYEEGLEQFAPTKEVAVFIESNKEKYLQEYRQTQKVMQKYLAHPLVRMAALAEPFKQPKRRLRTLGRARFDLDYAIFAEAKAQYLCDEADKAMDNKVLDAGYVIADAAPADAYRLRKDGGSVAIEKVGFDYEMYFHDPKRAEQIKQNREDTRSAYPAKEVPPRLTEKPVHLAVYLALLEEAGKPLPAELFQ